MRFVLVALFLSLTAFAQSPVIPSEQNETRDLSATFFVVQGDQNFEFIDRREGKHEVNTHLQYEILNEIRSHIIQLQKNALLFFDPPNRLPPFIEFYKKGILIAIESAPEDFTDPKTLAAVLEKGYAFFPDHTYTFFHWGYTIPFYPTTEFDLSHPNQMYDLGKLKASLNLANAIDPKRKFKTIALSTCFNSSLETLYALKSFTRYIIASEIYLHHHGFSSEFENHMDILTHTLSLLENLIPRGPASGKPVMDVSITLLDTESFWDFHDALKKIFYDVLDQMNDASTYPLLLEAFKKATLKNSRNKPYLMGLIDLKTFILAISPLLEAEDVLQFESSFSKVVVQHEKLQDTQDTGLHFYVPFHDHAQMQSIQQTPCYLRGIYLAYFLHALFQNHVQIFGLDMTQPFPTQYAMLIPYFPDGYVSPKIMQKVEVGLLVQEDVLIQSDFEITMTGAFSDQGVYWRRLGTYRFKNIFNQEIYLTEKTPDVLQGFLNQPRQKYKMTGDLYVTHGLWSKKRGLVFEVASVQQIFK